MFVIYQFGFYTAGGYWNAIAESETKAELEDWIRRHGEAGTDYMIRTIYRNG